MDTSKWEKMRAIFREAMERDPAKRKAFIESTCRNTSDLREELLALLEADNETGGFLETPATIEAGDDPLVGASIGQYLLTGVISSGGMGTVYEARQRKPERAVAVKVMRQGIASASALRRFEYEAEILARLRHPNIAQVFEAGTYEADLPYFVMEIVPDARSITDFAAQRRLSIRERLQLFLQVCAAVQHGHQRSIIHRDLKPSNLLVDGRGSVKVIDFGVARATDSDVTLTTVQTEVGQLIGTLQYMSPEQLKADPHDLDVRSDVYSLGMVLYELLCGRTPYDVKRTPVIEAARLIRETEPKRPSTMLKSLRGEVETIMLKALEKDRDERYSSVADLGADIERYLNGEVILARPSGPLWRLWKRARRNPVLSTAIVLIAVLLAVVPWILVQKEYEKRRITEEATVEIEQEKTKAETAEAEAVKRYEEIIRLSDVKRLKQLMEKEASLWPARPGKAPAMKNWIVQAEDLLKRLPGHREMREALQEEAGGSENVERQWRFDLLNELVSGLEALSDGTTGILNEVKKRLHWAEAIHDESIKKHEREWEEVIASIRDRSDCPRYSGMVLRAQIGFVPLGKDPLSGLHEFAHLQTGEPPKRGSDGRLVLTEETGLVFVLIPGGRFNMGSMPTTEENPLGAPNVDPFSDPSEMPVHPVGVNPFLFSKYEMTQGQWERFTGENPSYFSPNNRNIGLHYPLLHPVESVTWFHCRSTLHRLDLRLPTEAEWEYAARAGTSSVWWTGDEERSLANPVAANLADLYCKNHGGPKDAHWIYETWLNDGFAFHAPVGRFRPNAFGMRNMCGNVIEWCQDNMTGNYNGAPKDGSAFEVPDNPLRVMRGGYWAGTAQFGRSATRNSDAPEFRSYFIGVRPAYTLQ